jgi:L-alanine-DL-glutamate epimerase-like enolase superfamily enzyme
MKDSPKITGIEITRFKYPVENVAVDETYSMPVFTPGAKTNPTATVIQVHTDQGITGEYLGVTEPAAAQVKIMSSWLIGQDALEREHIYNHMKRALRHFDMTGIGLVDICLWDIAGKYFDTPLYRLLGGKKRPLPAYASTMHPDDNGGLSTPEDMADFAQQCVEMGYPAFKMHVWGNLIPREVATVLAVRDRVGDGIALLLDPGSQYPTFGNAVTVGRACDEANYFWLEDPYRDGGVSHTGHRRLRELIKTPLLQTEHVRLLEQHVNFITAGATDFVRAGAHEDGGITGAMKIAHAAEGFGLDVELHGPGPVHRHIMTSVRNTNFYELGLVHPCVKTNRPPVYIDYSDDLDAIDAEGNVHAPDGPGIGVDLDWDYIRKNRVDSAVFD